MWLIEPRAEHVPFLTLLWRSQCRLPCHIAARINSVGHQNSNILPWTPTLSLTKNEDKGILCSNMVYALKYMKHRCWTWPIYRWFADYLNGDVPVCKLFVYRKVFAPSNSTGFGGPVTSGIPTAQMYQMDTKDATKPWHCLNLNQLNHVKSVSSDSPVWRKVIFADLTWSTGLQTCSVSLLLSFIPIWLVVGPPLWKIWVRQLGWWDSQFFWENNIDGNQTTNQPIIYGSIFVSFPVSNPSTLGRPPHHHPAARRHVEKLRKTMR